MSVFITQTTYGMRGIKMSENYNYLRELSTPQLEELLRQTLDGNQPDIEYINYILEVIEEREKCNTENHLSNVNQSWKEFQQIYNSADCKNASLYDMPESEILKSSTLPQHRKHFFSIVRKALVAVLVTCLSLSMVASALGFNLFQAIGQWTKDVFSFAYAENDSNASPNNTENSSESFSNLQSALDSLNINEISAPTFIPDDYIASEAIVTSHLMSKEIQAYYTFANLTISISITKFEDVYSIQHEKDDNPVEMYIFNGICHYLFTNNGRTTATWNINSIECSIKGDISLDEMKEIINSMY